MGETYFIYMITAPNGKSYIGYTKDIGRRWRNHKHGPHRIGHAVRKYGDDMVYCVIATTDDLEHAHLLEKYCIAKLGTNIYGYNLTCGGEGVEGMVHSEESRKKMSDKLSGKPRKKLTKEHKAKLSDAKIGVKFSPGHKANLSAARNGMRLSKRHRENIGLALTKNIDMNLVMFNRFFKGHTYEQIAKVIGVTAPTISRRIRELLAT